MNIQIIAVGKIREKYIKEGIDEFTKRISSYASIKVTEIPAQNIVSDEFEEKCRNIEAEKILSHISNNTFVVTMEIGGKQLSSEGLASELKKFGQDGINHLVFVIGGATGIGQSVLDRSNYKLSMSKMTFPHQLARLFLIEQIYRAFKINSGEPYHK